MAIKFFMIILIFSLSLSLKADDEKIKSLMNSYLKGIHSSDGVKLKALTTQDYFKSVEKNYLTSKTVQRKEFIPFGFDIKINKANLDKNQFWVNIKDKKKASYPDYWYIVIRHKNSFKISDMVHVEE